MSKVKPEAKTADASPDEDTEVGKANKMAEKYKKPPHVTDRDKKESAS